MPFNFSFCQSQDLLAVESALSSSVGLLPVASFYWPFVLHLPDFQRKVTIVAPVAGCRSVWWKAWCRSPFLTISPGWNSCQRWICFSFPFFCDFLSSRPNSETVVCAFANVTPNILLNGVYIFS